MQQPTITKRADDSGTLGVVVNQLTQKVSQLEADINVLQTSSSTQNTDIQLAKSSTFIRWGNSHCSNGSELVYEGVIGGSNYNTPGSAANHLCLTMSPVFASMHNEAQLYGTEYESAGSAHDKDAVCSVCRSSYSSTIMVPGTNVCNPGWHLQYSGYLMAGHYGHAGPTEFICVDTAMESSPHTNQDDNGRLLYFTGAVCGSLPCDPYINGKTILCAVCSK